MKKFLPLILFTSCTTAIVTPQITETKKPSVNIAKVLEVVAASKCKDYSWKNRGKAPLGYIKGMSLLYAKHYCTPSTVTEHIAKPVGSQIKDALAWYGLKENPLRDIFTLAIGLGLRESSGKYCCGRDLSNPKTGTAEGAEAGTFQTSYNAAYSVQVNGNPPAANQMRALLPKYQTEGSECLLDVFKEGVNQAYCVGSNAQNYGTGTGLEYQKLAKSCPAFHAEFTLITLRNSKSHYGPIITKAAEINQDCQEMLKQIETTCI